jgi:hypothetical protein
VDEAVQFAILRAACAFLFDALRDDIVTAPAVESRVRQRALSIGPSLPQLLTHVVELAHVCGALLHHRRIAPLDDCTQVRIPALESRIRGQQFT